MREDLDPAAVCNCRFGNTELHSVFALLYLTVLGRFLHSAPRAPWHLRGIIGAHTVLGAASHVLFGGVCSSTAISAAVHDHFKARPLGPSFTFHLMQIRGWGIAGYVLCLGALAVHFLGCKSETTGRARKLKVLVETAAFVYILGLLVYCLCCNMSFMSSPVCEPHRRSSNRERIVR